jgi:hypothetical protein
MLPKNLMPVKAAHKKATGVNVHPATCYRWCTKKNKHGILLKSWIVGNKRLTTPEAIEEYINLNTELAGKAGTSCSPSTSHPMHKNAIEQLKKEGL